MSCHPTPSSRSFVDREISKRGDCIHKLTAKDSTGCWACYFVLVDPKLEHVFQKAIKAEGTMDLEDYGRVIASNYGEGPSDEVRAMLKEKYDFEV